MHCRSWNSLSGSVRNSAMVVVFTEARRTRSQWRLSRELQMTKDLKWNRKLKSLKKSAQIEFSPGERPSLLNYGNNKRLEALFLNYV